MRKSLSLALAACLLAAGSSSYAQSWSVVINEAITTSVAGGTNTNLNALGGNGSGVFVAGNLEGSNRKILKFDVNSTSVSVVATDAQIVAAIAAMNGTNADPAATAVRFQGLGFNANGKIIAYIDGASMEAALLSIEPTPPHTINVLSTGVNGTTSPVEGGNGLVLVGNTAYVLVDGAFGAAGDAVRSVDTATIVNDGSKTATTVVGEAALLAASGQTAADHSLNDIKFINANEAVVINSGVTNSNDNLVLVNVATGTASTYVAATDIEADLGVTDVGYGALAIDASGAVYLGNNFGVAADAADDGIIKLTGITPPNASASAKSELTMIAELGGTNYSTGADGLYFESSSNFLYAVSDGAGNSGLIRIQVGPSANVKDWSMY